MVISLLIRMQSAWYRNVLSQTAACKQHYNVRRKIPCNAHVDRRGLTYDVLDAIHIVYISLLSHIVCSCTWKKKKTQTNERSAIVCALHKYWSHFDLFRITTTITNGFVHQYATESLYVFSHCALLFIERIDLHAAMETHCKISSDWRWH